MCLRDWLDTRGKSDPFAFLDYLENAVDGAVGVCLNVRPSLVVDNGRPFEEVLLDDIPSTKSRTAPCSLLTGLLGPQLLPLLDSNHLKSTQASTQRPSWDRGGATARNYWQHWLFSKNNVDHMQREHVKKEAVLQILPASRQNVLRKRCTCRLIDYEELKALVEKQIDQTLTTYGVFKNLEDIVPLQPAIADSLTEWLDDCARRAPACVVE